MKHMKATLLTSATLTLSSLALHAQQPAPMPPPMLPVLTSYTYWPVQFVQFLGAEVPYSLIELDVDPGAKHPLLYVTLTERATGKRIHYTDNDGLIAFAKAQGEEAHKVALAYEPADNEAAGATTNLRFTTADEKPLEWRFVQGSDISEQGSGLTPVGEAKIPIFIYREQAAVAGEGTALKLGNVVSTASVWAEISHPPQFIAYHGAESQSAHTLVFTPGSQMWTVASAPSSLSVGATWELDEKGGNHRSIRIDRVDGTHVTATANDRFSPAVHTVVDATRTADGWTVDRLRFASLKDGEKHFLALQFAGADAASMSLMAGKRQIASGKLSGSGASADRAATLAFTSPAWLNGKTLVEGETVDGKTIVLTAHP